MKYFIGSLVAVFGVVGGVVVERQRWKKALSTSSKKRRNRLSKK